MKTLIVGTGVIGVIYGWALAEAGVDVTHYVRPGKAARFQKGIELDVLDERKGHPQNHRTHYAIRCVEQVQPQDGYDLVMVPVNADQLSEALRTLAPCTGKATFLLFTSNWTGLDEIDTLLPRERSLLGYAGGGGTIRADGLYWTNLGADLHLGAVEGQSQQALAAVKALFESADFVPEMHENMLHWLWVHNAGNIGFAAGFCKYLDFHHLLRDRAQLDVCLLATRELLHLCELRGVNIKDYPDVQSMFWPAWLVRLFMRWLYTTNQSMQRYTAHAVSAGSRRETYYHYCAMLKTAEQLGAPVPALRKLGEIYAARPV